MLNAVVNLYDPISNYDIMKYHKNVVEISITTGAKLMIYNIIINIINLSFINLKKIQWKYY